MTILQAIKEEIRIRLPSTHTLTGPEIPPALPWQTPKPTLHLGERGNLSISLTTEGQHLHIKTYLDRNYPNKTGSAYIDLNHPNFLEQIEQALADHGIKLKEQEE